MGGWQGALARAGCASRAFLPALMGVSCPASGLPGWAGDGLGAGTRDEWKSEAPSQVTGAQAGEDPGVGGRGWAGPRGAARPKRSGRRSPRDQEAEALRRRPEVSGVALGKRPARSRRPLPMTMGFEALGPGRARGIAGGAATTKVTCGLGADWRLGAGGADLGHRDSSPETKGQGRPPAPNQVHLVHVAGMDAGEGTASLQLPGPLLGVSERWLRLRGCKTLTLASPWRLEVAS